MKAVYGSNRHAFLKKMMMVCGHFPSDKNEEHISGNLITGTLSDNKSLIYLFVFATPPDIDTSECDDLNDECFIDVTPEDGSWLIHDKSTLLVIHSEKSVNKFTDLLFHLRDVDVEPGENWTHQVIIRLNHHEHLAALTDMLLVNEDCKIRLLKEKDSLGSESFLFLVDNIQLYSVLYLIGEKIAEVFYRVTVNDTLIPFFVPWGCSIPFLNYSEQNSLDSFTFNIFLDDGSMVAVNYNDFDDINHYLSFSFDVDKTIHNVNVSKDFNIMLTVDFKTADTIQQTVLPSTELWIVPESVMPLFLKDLYCPESALTGIEAMAFSSEAFGNGMLLWTGGLENHLEGLSLASLSHPDVLPFYRYSYLNENLYLLKNQIIFPHLEEDSLKALFNVTRETFTLVYKNSDNTISHYVFDLDDFKPVKKVLVNYEYQLSKQSMNVLSKDPVYTFHPPVEYIIPDVSKELAENGSTQTERDNEKISVVAAHEPAGSAQEEVLHNESDNTSSGEEPVLVKSTDLFSEETVSASPGYIMSYDELLHSYANEVLEKYKTMSLSDWVEYVKKSSYIKKTWKDAVNALISLLIYYPDEDTTDILCQGLGIDLFWIEENEINDLLEEIFDIELDKERIEIIVLTLYLVKNKVKEDEDFVLEDSNRHLLNDLKNHLFKSDNPKLIWLFCRVAWILTNDRQLIEDGRIRVQSLLQNPQSSLSLPPEMASILTNRFIAAYRDDINSFLSYLNMGQCLSLWKNVLTGFYIEQSGLFVFTESERARIETLVYGDETKGFSKKTVDQIRDFYLFLKDLFNCSNAHPSECPFANHLKDKRNTIASEFIEKETQTFTLDVNENTLHLIDFPKESHQILDFSVPFILNTIAYVRQCNSLELFQVKHCIAGLLIKHKENVFIKSILNLLSVCVNDGGRISFDSIDTYFGSGLHNDLEKQHVSDMVFLIMIMLTDSQEVPSEHDIHSVFQHIYHTGCLEKEDVDEVNAGDLQIVYYAINMVFNSLSQKKSMLNDIVYYEKHTLKGAIAKEYTEMLSH